MKIFYAVQATGNGHISRAMELLPFLEKYGTVDLFLSGANSTLQLNAPVKFRSKGVCFFYTSTGSLNYIDTVREFAPIRILKEARDLPVEKYDLVINDFECITSLACAHKKIPSVNFGHQASFQSNKVPRPSKKDFIGEWVLHNYARATQYIGLHFQSYDNFILPPVIKNDILNAEPKDKGHITVYLPSYCDEIICKYFLQLKDFRFEVFSKEVKNKIHIENVTLFPVNKNDFNKSMINCSAIITSAGFETPAEALFLGKKILAIPIRGQYEQLCNAAALEKMGVTCINAINGNFISAFIKWVDEEKKISISVDYSTEDSIGFLMNHCDRRENKKLDLLYPELVIN
ncbi:MAG TPA: glycosyltransferase family protein [Puia sp.]|nr:glycosyltransferase family protein [Puia sp.]